jgi:alpha-ketoglutarate-dependent 2,4-dichlorophenoxyacetate dioxygenase
VYQHHWQPDDLVMWDNTATVHRGRYFDYAQRRELRRATTEEVVTSPEALALLAAVAERTGVLEATGQPA